jgi:HSP20 family protein
MRDAVCLLAILHEEGIAMADKQKERAKRELTSWSPFSDASWWFPSLSRSSDGDFLEAFWGGRRGGEFSPATDITEDDGHYIVTAELPGLRRSDINVEIEGGVLTIRGEKKSEREEKSEKRRYVERTFGSFCRAFTLPSDADDSKVEASFKEGVLTVTVAKSEQRKPRVVDVKTE